MVAIYKVGGAVRDKLLGLIPTDNDYVVVGANKNYMLAHGFIEVGRDFPVYLHPETHEEYALARLERKTGAGHKAFTFETAETVTLIDDLKRRDITINAMALDQNNQLIDPFNGSKDLQNKIIRHISDSFAEDPLRVLRVARFAAKLNFTVASETIALMKDIVNSQEILHLSRERIIEEIGKALLTQYVPNFFQTLIDVDALVQILPDLDQTLKVTEASFSPNREEFLYAITLFDNYQCTLDERFAIIGYYMKNSQFFNKKSNRIAYILINTIPKIKNLHNLNSEEILLFINQLDPIRRRDTYLSIRKLFFLLAETWQDSNIIKMEQNTIKGNTNVIPAQAGIQHKHNNLFLENLSLIEQIIIKFSVIDYSELQHDANFIANLKNLKLNIINNILTKG